MDSRVFIIHSSAIIQKGLADILRRNFKCVVKSYFNLEAFKESANSYHSKIILFVEDNIANNEEYLRFTETLRHFISFCLVSNNSTSSTQPNSFTLNINGSPNEICEQVKHAFNEHQIVSDESEELSNREIDVLKLVALGYSNKEIADQLFISTYTVMSHRKNITEKLGIKSISGLTVYAIINSYIDTTNLDVKDLI